MRLTWKSRVLSAAILLGLLGTAAHASPSALRAIRTGRLTDAAEELRRALERTPNDPELHAMLGTVWSRLGEHGDAIEAFSSGQGSGWYEQVGLLYHADSLRWTGHGQRAAELRLSHRLVAPERAELNLLLSAIDDYRYAGRPDLAEALALEVLGIRPASSAAWGYLADALLDQGRFEEADAALFQGMQVPVPAMRTRMVEIQLRIADGDLHGAEEALAAAAANHPRSRRIAALRAEVLRALGHPEVAWAALRPRFDEDGAPELVAVRARILHDLGRKGEARLELERGLAVYADHPDVLHAQAHLAR